MNQIDVWKNQILLRWDREVPFRSAEENSKTYQDPLIKVAEDLRLNPASIEEHWEKIVAGWPHLKGHAKYNKKLGCFMLYLSKQNLWRVFNQFGKIPVTRGQALIDMFKQRIFYFNQDVAEAERIKKNPSPVESINYKVPPIGLYQHIGVELLMKTHRVPLFEDCGLGKCYQVLVSTEQQIKAGILKPGETLICAKLPTLEMGWEEDAKKFTGLHTVRLWIKQCKNRKEKLRELLNIPADLYLINHDGIRVLEEELASKRFKKIVVDESTVLKGFRGISSRESGGSFGKCLMHISDNALWRVIMSGTPAPNGPEDLWGQFYFLDPDGFLLEASWRDFKASYMEEVFFGKPVANPTKENPQVPSKWVTTKESAEKISKIVQPIEYRLKIRDHIKDLPESTIIQRKLELSAVQRKHYVELLTALSTVIDDASITAPVKIAQIMKLRQITGGFLIDHEDKPHSIPSTPKFEALDDLVLEEIDKSEKIVIYAQYRWEIESIESRYKDLGSVSVYGDNTSTQNLENIKRFINDASVKVIVLHPKSAAHGLTFTVSHYMIFYSISYSSEENYQCRCRIERAGQKHPMFFYYLIASKTIDEIIYSVLGVKDMMQRVLLDQEVVNNSIINELKQLKKELL